MTEILSDCTDKSGALTQWSANMVVEWIKQNVPQRMVDKEEGLFFAVFEDELNNARFNFRDVSKKALDIGSAVHEAIEYWLKTGKEPKWLQN